MYVLYSAIAGSGKTSTSTFCRSIPRHVGSVCCRTTPQCLSSPQSRRGFALLEGAGSVAPRTNSCFFALPSRWADSSCFAAAAVAAAAETYAVVAEETRPREGTGRQADPGRRPAPARQPQAGENPGREGGVGKHQQQPREILQRETSVGPTRPGPCLICFISWPSFIQPCAVCGAIGGDGLFRAWPRRCLFSSSCLDKILGPKRNLPAKETGLEAEKQQLPTTI